MRSLLPLHILLVLGPIAPAQDSFQRYVQNGTWQVGYTDTLLYTDSVSYSQFGYQGPAPLFAQLWHPLPERPPGPPMTFRAFRERSLPPPLRPVYAALTAAMDTSFVDYCIREPFDSMEPIGYGSSTPTDVLDTIRELGTISYRARPVGKLSGPVILYHHGAQGMSDENHAMAEYFASRGYGFVSANFHWPIEGAMYGTPLSWQPDYSALRTMVRFARSLTTSDSVFYIGHSWGAQQGWCTLFEPGLAQAFVSMETTIEFKTDTNEIKDKWPDVYRAVRSEQHRYPLPILLFADTEGDGPFDFFVGTSTQEMFHLDPKEPFGHESYTSAYLMRYLVRDRFPQPDTLLMRGQLELYVRHLEAIGSFLNAVRTKGEFPTERFTDAFHLHRTGVNGATRD